MTRPHDPGYENRQRSTTYRAEIRCMNCGGEFVVDIPKGTTIFEHVKDKPCLNCGCLLLVPKR
jgi:hypothetical protein